jgi:hypothetical protein
VKRDWKARSLLLPARLVLLSEARTPVVLQEFAVVGEVSYIKLDGCGEVLLEGGFALEEPAGKVQERGGIVAGEDEGGVDEGVRLDEGSVEVDAEHGENGVGGSVGRGNRDGQKCVLLFAGLGLSLVFGSLVLSNSLRA